MVGSRGCMNTPVENLDLGKYKAFFLSTLAATEDL